MSAITAGPGNAVQNMNYTYDALGNLLTRQDTNTGLAETFTYDPLSRLTSSTVGASAQKLFGYDALGNILSKSDVGAYAYPLPGQPRPHGVVSIAGATINTTFSYDPNGNQTAGLGRTISYTSYNKQSSFTQATRTITFSHDMDHQRFKQVAPEGTTLYIGGFGLFVELYQSAAGNRWNEYLSVGRTMIGVRFLFADETVNTRYFHHDHLGSVAVITNEAGAVVERSSHDAWGKRRHPDGNDDTTGTLTSLTTQGFTGQEELAGFGLVHLNGRVYDPLVGRMMSADPLVPEPMNAQAWNRYAYVINNPLAFTDPSGYSWLSEAFHFVQGILRSIPLLGSIIRIAAVAICAAFPGCQPFLPLVAAATSAAVAGIQTGKLSAALQAGFIAGATALAFNAVGSFGGSSQADAYSAFAQAPEELPEVAVFAPLSVTIYKNTPVGLSSGSDGWGFAGSAIGAFLQTPISKPFVDYGSGPCNLCGAMQTQRGTALFNFPVRTLTAGDGLLIGLQGATLIAPIGRVLAGGVAGGAARPFQVGRFNDLKTLSQVEAAQAQYPNLAGKTQEHHIWPKYLGGPSNGPTTPLDAAYHQVITNAFRDLHPYGSRAPSTQQAQDLMHQVYKQFPLP